MARVRQNFWSGTLSSQLLSGATTLMSSALSTFPAVTTPDVAYLVIDPDGSTPEIVKVTAHTASATTATIVRGQDSTTDRTWASGTTVKQNTIGTDFDLDAYDATIEVQKSGTALRVKSPNQVSSTDVYLFEVCTDNDTLRAGQAPVQIRAGGLDGTSLSATDAIWQILDANGAYIAKVIVEGGMLVNDNIRFQIYDGGLGYIRGLGMEYLDSPNNEAPALVLGRHTNVESTVTWNAGTTTVESNKGLWIRDNDDGDIEVAGDIVPASDGTYQIGTTTVQYGQIHSPWVPNTVYLTSDFSTQTSSTDPTTNNDTALAFDVVSGGVYAFEFHLAAFSSGTATPDVVYRLDAPASSAGIASVQGMNSAATGIAAGTVRDYDMGINATSDILGVYGGANLTHHITGTVEAGGTGTVTLQAAQGTSNGTATQIKKYSRVTWQRIA